ncbi:hypothetical protein PINS_up012545 [Pythium insidiosum]|nr:hypothetical protein PINS_up012545 [Pythium insidiosum]
MWRHIAVRQFRQRRDAELENEQLKIALQAQLRTADALQRLIQRAPSVAPSCSDPRVVCAERVIDVADAARMPLLEALVCRLTSMHSMVQKASKVAEAVVAQEGEFRDVRVETDAIAIRFGRLLPLSVQACAELLWRNFRWQSQVPTRDNSKPSCWMRRFHLHVETGDATGWVEGVLVGKQTSDSNRQHHIAWTGHYKPLGSSFSEFDGAFEFQSEGCMLLDTITVDGVELTRLLMQHDVQPAVIEATPESRLALQLVAEFVVSTITQHHEALQRQLESLFLHHEGHTPDMSE